MPVLLSGQEIESKSKEIEKFRGDLFETKYLREVKAFPDVRKLFQRLLADGWKLALASSAKEDELKIYKKVCRITDLVDEETSSEDAKKSKPHPDIFQAAMKRLGNVRFADCIVVGDSPFDAEAATKAGIHSVGFLSGGFPKDDLRKAGYETLYEGSADVSRDTTNPSSRRKVHAPNHDNLRNSLCALPMWSRPTEQNPSIKRAVEDGRVSPCYVRGNTLEREN